jgi:tRNA pseudouridine55 synthase
MKSFPSTLDEFLIGQTFLINKPLGWSSFDVVKKMKYIICKKYNLKKIKIGHAGTLDPLATGLLIVCTGKFTKKNL